MKPYRREGDSGLNLRAAPLFCAPLAALLLTACVNPEATKPLPPPHGNAVATNAPENAQ